MGDLNSCTRKKLGAEERENTPPRWKAIENISQRLRPKTFKRNEKMSRAATGNRETRTKAWQTKRSSTARESWTPEIASRKEEQDAGWTRLSVIPQRVCRIAELNWFRRSRQWCNLVGTQIALKPLERRLLTYSFEQSNIWLHFYDNSTSGHQSRAMTSLIDDPFPSNRAFIISYVTFRIIFSLLQNSISHTKSYTIKREIAFA